MGENNRIIPFHFMRHIVTYALVTVRCISATAARRMYLAVANYSSRFNNGLLNHSRDSDER
jgi:hypothetical protein